MDSPIDQIYVLLLNELEILRDQMLPKFPCVVHWIRSNSNCGKRIIGNFCQDLRNLLITQWNEFFKCLLLQITKNNHNEIMKNSILTAIESKFKNIFSSEEIESLFKIIFEEFISLVTSKIVRITRQFTDDTIKFEPNSFLLVSTLDGKLSVVNIFYGIVVFSYKTGPPLFYTNLSTFSVIHNNKSIKLIPSLNGSLFKWKYKEFAEPLNLTIEELLTTDTHTSDVLFTGSKKTYITSLFQTINDSSTNSKISCILETFKSSLRLLIKRTTQTLLAHNRHNHKKMWNFSVSHIDLITEQYSCSSHEQSSLIHNFKINAQRGEIFRLIDHTMDHNQFFWKLKLKSCITNAWIYEDNKLKKFDLFTIPHVYPIGNNLPQYFICTHNNKSLKKRKAFINESNEMKNELLNIKSNWLDLMFNEKPVDENFTTSKRGNLIYVYKQLNNECENRVNMVCNSPTYSSQFEKNFKLVKKLGNGGFGVVIEACHNYDKCHYAVKRIKIRNVNLQKKIQREVEVQANLNHENVVNYHNSWLEEPPLDWDDPLESMLEDEEQYSSTISCEYSTSYGNNYHGFFYIQMQLCKGGNLREWLNNNNAKDIRIKQYKNIFEQILNGVEYIHNQGLIHRDLKPENIFFFSENNIKIGDFGLVTNISEPVVGTPLKEKFPLFKNIEHVEHTPNVGTSLYMAPEQRECKKYDYKVDIWSLAIVLVELLLIFKTGTERWKVLEKLQKREFPQLLIEEFPEEYNTLQLMLKHNPEERLCTYGIRSRSPIFHNVDECYHFNIPEKY